MRRFLSCLRRYLVSGTLTLLPVSVTLWVVSRVFLMLDGWSANIATKLIGRRIPAAGFVITLALLVGTGAVATNMIGRRLLARCESLLTRVPLVRSIYTAVRQMVDAFASPQKAPFKTVVLLEYPRRGIWSLGFLTSAQSALLSDVAGQRLATVFVPTTPNPTSGFFLAVPREECIVLDMSVENAFRLIVSGGAINPATARRGVVLATDRPVEGQAAVR